LCNGGVPLCNFPKSNAKKYKNGKQHLKIEGLPPHFRCTPRGVIAFLKKRKRAQAQDAPVVKDSSGIRLLNLAKSMHT